MAVVNVYYETMIVETFEENQALPVSWEMWQYFPQSTLHLLLCHDENFEPIESEYRVLFSTRNMHSMGSLPAVFPKGQKRCLLLILFPE